MGDETKYTTFYSEPSWSVYFRAQWMCLPGFKFTCSGLNDALLIRGQKQVSEYVNLPLLNLLAQALCLQCVRGIAVGLLQGHDLAFGESYLHVIFFTHDFPWSPLGVCAVHRVHIGCCSPQVGV